MKNIKAMLKFIPMLALGMSLSTILIITTSCHHDDPKPPTRTDTLTSGNWKLTEYTWKCPGELNPHDLMQNLSDCDKDNLHVFKTDKKYLVAEGTLPCAGGDANIGQHGTWAFVDGEKKLRFEFPYIASPVGDFSIDKLTNTTLKLTEPNYDGSPGCVANLTFTKQ